MATTASPRQTELQQALVNYLVGMGRTVEETVERAVEALLRQDEKLASRVFLTEPRVNEMEIVIDEQAVRLLRGAALPDEDVRFVVATLKITNDLERMGDLAVNIGERVVTLGSMQNAAPPAGLEPMAEAVLAMVRQSLGALVERDAGLAHQVLSSDDLVDRYRDQIFERLLTGMTADAARVAPNMQFVLATRYLERIADHCTNIAEDVVYWLRGLEVRHGRGRQLAAELAGAGGAASASARKNPQA